jgi:hypothetical protein
MRVIILLKRGKELVWLMSEIMSDASHEDVSMLSLTALRVAQQCKR